MYQLSTPKSKEKKKKKSEISGRTILIGRSLLDPLANSEFVADSLFLLVIALSLHSIVFGVVSRIE